MTFFSRQRQASQLTTHHARTGLHTDAVSDSRARSLENEIRLLLELGADEVLVVSEGTRMTTGMRHGRTTVSFTPALPPHLQSGLPDLERLDDFGLGRLIFLKGRNVAFTQDLRLWDHLLTLTAFRHISNWNLL